MKGKFAAYRNLTIYCEDEGFFSVSGDENGVRCSVTINGRERQITDLRPGDLLVIDGQPAVSITATR